MVIINITISLCLLSYKAIAIEITHSNKTAIPNTPRNSNPEYLIPWEILFGFSSANAIKRNATAPTEDNSSNVLSFILSIKIPIELILFYNPFFY